MANYLVLGDSHASSGKEVDSPDTHITGRCDPDCLTTTTITTTSIPEPTSWAIFALGIVGLSLSRRQRN